MSTQITLQSLSKNTATKHEKLHFNYPVIIVNQSQVSGNKVLTRLSDCSTELSWAGAAFPAKPDTPAESGLAASGLGIRPRAPKSTVSPPDLGSSVNMVNHSSILLSL